MEKPTYIAEYDAIVAVLNTYCTGCVQADSSIMQPAFNQQACVFGIDAGGKLEARPVQDLFNEIDSDGFRASPEARTAITRIDIVGTVASARVDMNDIGSGFCFTDFFHLLKVAGQWTVVGKIFHAHVTP